MDDITTNDLIGVLSELQILQKIMKECEDLRQILKYENIENEKLRKENNDLIQSVLLKTGSDTIKAAVRSLLNIIERSQRIAKEPIIIGSVKQSEEISKTVSKVDQAEEKINVQERQIDSKTDKLKVKRNEIEDLKNELERFKVANFRLSEAIAELARSDTEKSQKIERAEKEADNLKSQNVNLIDRLNIQCATNGDLKKELERLNRDKTRSETEKLKEIKTLTSERNRILQENETLKMLNGEMSEEIESLRFLCNENSNQTEPEVQLENELEDTTCTICREDMRLQKCTPCRRRYHKSCIDTWLNGHRTCPTCRAAWNN